MTADRDVPNGVDGVVSNGAAKQVPKATNGGVLNGIKASGKVSTLLFQTYPRVKSTTDRELHRSRPPTERSPMEYMMRSPTGRFKLQRRLAILSRVKFSS